MAIRLTPLCFLLTLFILESRGQVVGRLYYDESWTLTSREAAVYFRVSVIDTANRVFVGPVKDFTKDGKPIMSGSYSAGKKHGVFQTYFPSGKVASEGEYAEGVRSGKWTYYHPNQSVRCQAIFDKGEPRVLSLLDSSGNSLVRDGTGSWTDSYVEPYTGVNMAIAGKINNGLLEGKWTRATPDGTVWYEAQFAKGEFIEGSILADGMKIETLHPLQDLLPEDAKHVLTERFQGLDKMATAYPYLKEPPFRYEPISTLAEYGARPKRGMAGFYEEVSRMIKYPPDARRKGIEGRVFVEFVVDKDGALTEVKVIRGVGGGCDEEAVRVVRATGKWIPAVQKRSRVKQIYTLPIIFRLG